MDEEAVCGLSVSLQIRGDDVAVICGRSDAHRRHNGVVQMNGNMGPGLYEVSWDFGLSWVG